MAKWELALNKFLVAWKKNKEVVGALVCGSFIIGKPTKRSDIDLHIVLSEKTKWRERGNKIVDGFLVEYFANPVSQIRNYFAEDYKNGKQMAATQFATGKILFDDGTVAGSKKEAKKWLDKKFVKPSRVKTELTKYVVWDMLDNLQDNFESDKIDFWFVFHNFLAQLTQIYCQFTGYPLIKDYKTLDILQNKEKRKKYLLKDFPDNKFSILVGAAILEDDKKKALLLYEEITKYILSKMGGFEIDGWKIKSKVNRA